MEKVEKGFVLIDGEAARKKCNIAHLEPLNILLDDIKRSSDKSEILEALTSRGLKIRKKITPIENKRVKKDGRARKQRAG